MSIDDNKSGSNTNCDNVHCAHDFVDTLSSQINYESLARVQYPKCAYGPYRLFNPIQNGVYI